MSRAIGFFPRSILLQQVPFELVGFRLELMCMKLVITTAITARLQDTQAET
jgi:hypothetical protein